MADDQFARQVRSLIGKPVLGLCWFPSRATLKYITCEMPAGWLAETDRLRAQNDRLASKLGRYHQQSYQAYAARRCKIQVNGE
jgi:hypothetical protein